MTRSNYEKYFSNPENAAFALGCIDKKKGVKNIKSASACRKEVLDVISGKSKRAINLDYFRNAADWLDWLNDEATEE